VLSRYLDKYGYEGLFPVARTPLGNLATLICFDVNFPETSRALVKRGAEVILHPTAEVQSARRRGWEKARLTRAFENTAYFISAGLGGEFRHYQDALPGHLHGGYSKIVGFDGTIVTATDGPGRVCIAGTLDLGALRRARADATANLALWDDAGAYAEFYRRHAGFPEDVWLDTPMQKGSEGIAAVNKVVERYTTSGVFVAPKSAQRFER
jgi:predicted amidohydrolase